MYLAQILTEAMETNEITSAAILIPVITGIVQAFKLIGMKEKYAPLAAIGTGAALAVLLRNDLQTITNAIFTGIIFGLSSSGLYSGLVHSLKAGGQNNQQNNQTSPQTSPQQPQNGAAVYPMTTTLNDGQTSPQTTIIVDSGASIKHTGDGVDIETKKE